MLISANDRFILFSSESNGAFQVHFIRSFATEVWQPLGWSWEAPSRSLLLLTIHCKHFIEQESETTFSVQVKKVV